METPSRLIYQICIHCSEMIYPFAYSELIHLRCVEQRNEVKALAMQAQQVTEKALKGASKVELRNPQWGKYFRIISEVWIDGESLADMLKAKGLAKDYNGEGARPVW